MFDIDEFIADCVAAKSEPNPMLAVKETMDRAMSRRDEIAGALPATQAEFDLLYSSAEMSILKFVWGPAMSVPPHDHLMWAVNGIYVGAEDNVFWRRDPEGGIVESGRRRVGAAESAVLGRDVIHAVTNPDGRACTGSIHVYGGDYLRKKRSVWDPQTHQERPADGETIRRMFEAARAAAEPRDA
jgi:predicted metal-dependent enzyme (double-stranded beta helix superfamily)